MTGIAPGGPAAALNELVPDLSARASRPLREPLVSGAAQVLAPALHKFLIPCPRSPIVRSSTACSSVW